MKEIIKEYVRKKAMLSEAWYHGTYDADGIKNKGFDSIPTSVEYIQDMDEFNRRYELLEKMRDSGKGYDKDYHAILDSFGELRKRYRYTKPIFLTNEYRVAKTYADSRRAFYSEEATEGVLEVYVDYKKLVKITAIGDRFRFISTDKVRKGFIDAGASEEEIDKALDMFNYFARDKGGIQTDTIAAIGSWLGFDCIDVIGVLDSYNVGTIKSTVRMVLDPNIIKVLK